MHKLCINKYEDSKTYLHIQSSGSGGSRGTLWRHTTSGVEHTHICDACTHILLRTYRVVFRVGGAETKGTQVRSDLPDAHEVYPVVTTGASSSGSGGSGRVRSNREDNGEKQVRG